MKHIRLRIIDLIDQHGGSFDKCPGCAACTEIERLRKILEREPEDKFKHILDKGQDMTKSDIAFLLENEVQKKVIKKALKMDSTGFLKMMTNLGFTKRRQPKEEETVGKTGMTVEEFVDLRYKQKLTFEKIAKLKGVRHPSIISWKDRHADEIKKALKELNLPIKEEKIPPVVKKTEPVKAETKQSASAEYRVPKFEPIQKPIQPDTAVVKVPETQTIEEAINKAIAEKTAEYERLIAALRSDLNEAHKQIDEKDERIRGLEHLHDACEDTENELAELLKVNGELQHSKEMMEQRNKALGEALQSAKEYLESTRKAIEDLNKENQVMQEREKELQESSLIYRVQLEDAEKKLQEMEDEYQTLRWLVKKWA